jgi:hypothetical protein
MTTTQTTIGPDIDTVPVHRITVNKNTDALPGKIGTPEFEAALFQEFLGKHAWRSSSGLAKKLNVDVKELDDLLNKDKRFAKATGETDGTFLYAVKKRVLAENEGSKKTSLKGQLTISPSDRYALAMLSFISCGLENILEKYALKINEQSEEALSHLTKALKHVKSGTVLLAQATNADMNHLLKN